ncbi:MAG: hypothetical protein M1530_04065 [Candidatus Marsarchaeota archaeon]|nr:hypothetical protein [Candidatus Marsarchaeota archaeon]
MKAPVRLMVLDCTAPKGENGIHTSLRASVYEKKAAQASFNRPIQLSFFRPEEAKRMPAIRSFDSLVMPDSSYTPTKEFMEKTELGRMLPDFVRRLIGSGKPSLCISFGMEAVSASLGVYPQSVLELTDKRVFNAGYYEVKLAPWAKSDVLFGTLPEHFSGAFVHRYFLPGQPKGTILLARINAIMPVAAFKAGSTYCVQWCPDHSTETFGESISQQREHDASIRPLLPFLLPVDCGRQNSLVLDGFLQMIVR